MIARLFKSKARPAAPLAPTMPEGTVVWTIGDVHGRLDLLEPLVEAIRADASTLSASRKTVIFLGDYVDRGPQSRDVLLFLAGLSADLEIEWRFLRGNHEETMLDFLRDPTVGQQWCEYGGDATLASYGLRVPDLRHRSEPWEHLSADLNHKLTKAEREFLESLEVSISLGDYFFVHAGARPGVPLDQQATEDMLWIRRTFLDSEVEFDRVIVHGHTPTKIVHADRRRLGIDTKAYASGVLTAVRLMGADRIQLQTRIDEVGQVRVVIDKEIRILDFSAA